MGATPLKFGIPVDMQQLEILKLRLEQLATDPATPVSGQTWYNTTSKIAKIYMDGVVEPYFSASALTIGYVPYKVSTLKLADSPIFTNATNVGIGFATPLSALCINGGLHVGGESAAGDNNLLVDGTGEITGISTLTGYVKAMGGIHVGGTSDPGVDNILVDGYIRSSVTPYVSQTTGWNISQAGAGDFRYLYTDELHAKSFIADLEQALAGGQIICKSVSLLGAAFTAPAAGGAVTLTMKDLPSAENMAVFESGDYIRIRTFSRAAGSLTIADCWGVVTTYTDQANKLQTWTFTRGSGANAGSMAQNTVVAVDSIVLDYGVTGNGFYEVNAIDGLYGVNSPYAQVVTWTTSPIAANQVCRARLGNLKGIFSVANEYGLYAGDGIADASKYFRISNTSIEIHNVPIKMYDGAVNTVLLSATTPSFAMGATLPTGYLSNGSGIWMGKDTNYKMRVGTVAGGVLTEGFSWDNTTFSIKGTVTATTGTIGGFTIGATTLLAGAAATRIELNTAVGIHMGATAFADAKFSVTRAGAVKAISGTVGGCALAATSIGSTTFVSGPLGSGWNISNTGTAEFQNALIRGTLRTTVFEKDTISAVNGLLLITKADILAADMTILDSSTLTISGESSFVNNEVIRIKDGVDDEWMLVTNAAGAPTYVVTRDLAVAYVADNNPTWKKGTTVVSMGVGTGTKTGYILFDSSSANSPYIDIYGRNSNLFGDVTLHARVGWLKGLTDADVGLATTDTWGIYSDNAYIKGVIVANTGYIGGASGWTIAAGSISSVNAGNTTTMASGGTNAYIAGTTGAPQFKVTHAGALTATSANITGAITASSGSIGSFTIGTYLYTGTKTAYNDANAGIHIGSDGIGIGNNLFTVSVAGALTAISGAIGGWTVAAQGISYGTPHYVNGYTAAAGDITLAADGSLHAQKFYINVDGSVSFNATGSVLETTPVLAGDLAGTVANTQANRVALKQKIRFTKTASATDLFITINSVEKTQAYNTSATQTCADFWATHGATAWANVTLSYPDASDYLDVEANVAGTAFTYSSSSATESVTQANVTALKQIDTVTLTGTSGTANVVCDAVTRLATWNYNGLTATAVDFVVSHAASYLTGGVVVTSSGADIIFTSETAGTAFTGATSIANVGNTFRGLIKLQGNDIWEDSIDDDTYGVIRINYNGYAGGPTRHRITMIGGGTGSSVAVFSAKDGSGALRKGLDVRQGSLSVPQITTTERNALEKWRGMIVYDTTLEKFCGVYYSGGALAWRSFDNTAT